MNNREARKLFKFKKYNEGYSVVDYRGSDSEVIIPAQYRKKAVIAIEYCAFCHAFCHKSMESITIPSTVVMIDDNFYDAKIKLEDGNATYEVINNCLIEKATKKVISGGKDSIIPEGVKEIGDGAFCNTSIESVTIPSTVEKIGETAFEWCKNLKTVTLNEGLKEIGFNAFNHTAIDEITMPNTMEKIGEDAFFGCENLKTVTLNEGLKEIGSSAFVGTSIETITIPSTVEKVDSSFGYAKIKVMGGNAKYEVIDNCLIEKATKKLISGGKYSAIPEGVKEIGDSVFCYTSIETIIIPNTVKEIGDLAFCNCENLKTVILNEGLKRIGEGAFMYSSIETIIIPSTVGKIEDSIFHGCENIKTVTLKEGLKSIERRAFRSSSIKTITIPSTVEEIESLAFDGCSKLKAIECNVKKSYVEANKSKFEGLLEQKSKINWLNG